MAFHLTNAELVIAGIVGTLAGAGVGGWASYLGAKHSASSQEKVSSEVRKQERDIARDDRLFATRAAIYEPILDGLERLRQELFSDWWTREIWRWAEVLQEAKADLFSREPKVLAYGGRDVRTAYAEFEQEYRAITAKFRRLDTELAYALLEYDPEDLEGREERKRSHRTESREEIRGLLDDYEQASGAMGLAMRSELQGREAS